MEEDNNDATTTIPWSALPSDLVGAISRRLETRYDLRHFRQVCHNWRHFTPLSLLHRTAALHPLLLITIPGQPRVYSGRPLKLVATAVYLLRPTLEFTHYLNYAVDRDGLTHYLNYGGTEKVLAANLILQKGSDVRVLRKWLVELDGGLYLVNRYVNTFTADNALKFEVYELDFSGGCWNRVKSLGDDRILFVTYDGAFFANVVDFPGWRGNCIVYYTGRYFSKVDGRAPDDRACKELVIAVYYFDGSEDAPTHDYSGLRHIGHYENYCKLFWPPPAWVV